MKMWNISMICKDLRGAIEASKFRILRDFTNVYQLFMIFSNLSLRGQTQSQYLNFGKPEQDGKAEAEANELGSRSTVSKYQHLYAYKPSYNNCNICSW